MFAQLIGATADDIALVPATSYGIAVAAANLAVEAQQEIVVLEQQFPSNYYAWHHLAETRDAALVTAERRRLDRCGVGADRVLDGNRRGAALPLDG